MSKSLQLVWVSWLLMATLLEAAPVENTYLQQLGLLLGLPVDVEEASLERGEPPKFVKDIYNCLNSNQTDSCLPGYHGNDVNQLRTSLGTGNPSPSPALHSFNKQRELNHSFGISFNVSLTVGQSAIIRYAMLRVYREPLSADKLASLHQSCSNLSNISLQLYTQIGEEGDTAVFSLQAVQSLSGMDPTQEEWVEFLNLTNMYNSLVMDGQNKLHNGLHIITALHTRLVVRAPACPSLSPSDLGFVSFADHRAQLVGFEDSTIEADYSRVLSFIAKESHKRARRQVEDAAGSGDLDFHSLNLATEATEVPTPARPVPVSATGRPPLGHHTEYTNNRCTLYHHYISFAALGWNTIVSPAGYRANFCAGNCLFPPQSTEEFTSHALYQSLANLHSEGAIPPPCCVPRPGTYKNLTVAINETSGFVIRTYKHMIATECICM